MEMRSLHFSDVRSTGLGDATRMADSPASVDWRRTVLRMADLNVPRPRTSTGRCPLVMKARRRSLPPPHITANLLDPRATTRVILTCMCSGGRGWARDSSWAVAAAVRVIDDDDAVRDICRGG